MKNIYQKQNQKSKRSEIYDSCLSQQAGILGRYACSHPQGNKALKFLPLHLDFVLSWVISLVLVT